MDQQVIKAALDWQLAMGADEAVGDSPADWSVADMPDWWLELKGAPAKVPAGLSPSSLPIAEPISRALHEPAAAPLQMFTTPTIVTVQAQTLTDLAAEFKAFDGIGLKKTALNFVFADGNPESRVMVIGETPDADDDKQGRPFVGPSGHLLDQMLAAISLKSRDDYYITNVSPWRPPGNRTPTEAEITMLRPFLVRQIELVKPAVIVTLGALAVKTLLSKPEGITRLRGKFLSFQPDETTAEIPLLPLFHPAALLRNPGQKAATWADLLSLKEFLITNKLLK